MLFPEDEVFQDFMDMAAKAHREYANRLDSTAVSILRLYCKLLIERRNRITRQQIFPATETAHHHTAQAFKTGTYQKVFDPPENRLNEN